MIYLLKVNEKPVTLFKKQRKWREKNAGSDQKEQAEQDPAEDVERQISVSADFTDYFIFSDIQSLAYF